MAIRCCHGCMAPKRHPSCHVTCPEHLKEKAEHDALAAENYKKRQLALNLNQQKYSAVVKASKRMRKHKEK